MSWQLHTMTNQSEFWENKHNALEVKYFALENKHNALEFKHFALEEDFSQKCVSIDSQDKLLELELELVDRCMEDHQGLVETNIEDTRLIVPMDKKSRKGSHLCNPKEGKKPAPEVAKMQTSSPIVPVDISNKKYRKGSSFSNPQKGKSKAPSNSFPVTSPPNSKNAGASSSNVHSLPSSAQSSNNKGNEPKKTVKDLKSPAYWKVNNLVHASLQDGLNNVQVDIAAVANEVDISVDTLRNYVGRRRSMLIGRIRKAFSIKANISSRRILKELLGCCPVTRCVLQKLSEHTKNGVLEPFCDVGAISCAHQPEVEGVDHCIDQDCIFHGQR